MLLLDRQPVIWIIIIIIIIIVIIIIIITTLTYISNISNIYNKFFNFPTDTKKIHYVSGENCFFFRWPLEEGSSLHPKYIVLCIFVTREDVIVHADDINDVRLLSKVLCWN